MAGLFDFVKKNPVIAFVVALVVIYLIMNLFPMEGLENVEQQAVEEAPKQEATSEASVEANSYGEFQPSAVEFSPEDLLPKYDEQSEFAQQNPVSELLKEKNFLISGYHVGVNTVMQSNKIPYHDLRSLPPIPKQDVGPWSQSSYEKSPAAQRRGFEIGV